VSRPTPRQRPAAGSAPPASGVSASSALVPGPLALGPLADLLGWHLAQATVPTTAAFERHVGVPFALRKVEFSLLMLLLANAPKGPVSPKVLAQALALTAPKLTMLLDRLQQRGLLQRDRNPDDGRSQHIVLTDEGQRLARGVAAAALPMEQDLAQRLSRAEYAMLVELLSKLGGRRPPR
jgi:DNA-binding MarR family transcriptional regulator